MFERALACLSIDHGAVSFPWWHILYVCPLAFFVRPHGLNTASRSRPQAADMGEHQRGANSATAGR